MSAAAPPGPSPEILTRDDGGTIAYHAWPGNAPGVMFLGGFMSDMTGTKAAALEAACRRTGRAYVRFDYRGHGASSGHFTEGTIGRWAEDAMAVLDQVAEGPQVLVGSSMGGWIMLLTALARRERIAGLVGIAAAPDFTERLMWQRYDATVKRLLETEGLYLEPSDYGDEPYPITHRLIQEGRGHLLLDAPVELDCPVRLIHGLDDRDVPWELSLALTEALTSTDVTLELIKDGDHRLSEPGPLATICRTVLTLCAEIGTGG